jgi:hypothetical protein
MQQCLRQSRAGRLAVLTLGLLIAAFIGRNSTAAADKTADSIAAAREQLYKSYAGQLQNLADDCASQGLAQQADLTKKWLPHREPATFYVFILPADSAAPASLAETPAAQKWWQKFMEIRRGEAESLFTLARRALDEKQYALAFELARETVRENPGHEAARHVLGDRKHGDAWVSADVSRRLDAGQVWSDEFGWLPADRLKRYQDGQRNYRGNWITAAEDARLHSNIRNGWNVESEHYSIITNDSLESAAKLARRLELLNTAWRQIFVGFYARPAQVEQWFATPAPTAGKAADDSQPTTPPENTKRHQVTYFHDKQQYVDALKALQPKIEMSIGYYSDAARTAYFFASDQPYLGTLNHEASHQLFRETPPASVDPGRKNNFWIFEAIACYMESLEEHQLMDGESYGSYLTVGGANAGRVPAARQRLQDDHFYVPFRELVTYGASELQHDPRVTTLYSQIAGQAWFLMHADHGRYRDALMKYLVDFYTGHTTVDTLEKLTGEKFEQLDQQYADYMQ